MITKAKTEHINQMIDIKIACVKKMIQNGNDLQYQDDIDAYPNKETFIQDIKDDSLYVYLDNDKVCGFFYLQNTIEKPFEEYGFKKGKTVHRLFVDINQQGKGIAKQLVEFAFDNLEDQERLFIDTHLLNKPLQGLVNKLGFTKLGDIYWKLPKNEVNRRIAFVKEK